jgi:glyoxylate utilization-related uncharacterized protein
MATLLSSYTRKDFHVEIIEFKPGAAACADVIG